jgi:hypothetical protein
LSDSVLVVVRVCDIVDSLLPEEEFPAGVLIDLFCDGALTVETDDLRPSDAAAFTLPDDLAGALMLPDDLAGALSV